MTIAMGDGLGETLMAAFTASPPAVLQHDDFAIDYAGNPPTRRTVALTSTAPTTIAP